MADLRQNRVLWLIDEHKGRLVRQKNIGSTVFPLALCSRPLARPAMRERGLIRLQT